MQQVERTLGTINALMEEKRYGFITSQSGESVFFLFRSLRKQDGQPTNTEVGTRVAYTLVPVQGKRAEAIDIEVL